MAGNASVKSNTVRIIPEQYFANYQRPY